MVDAADSKSAGGDTVGVRVSPPAPSQKKSGREIYAEQEISGKASKNFRT